MLVKEDLAELKDETYKDVKSEHNNQDAEPLAKRTIQYKKSWGNLWSKRETEFLFCLVEKHGRNYKVIAEKIGNNKTATDVKRKVQNLITAFRNRCAR